MNEGRLGPGLATTRTNYPLPLTTRHAHIHRDPLRTHERVGDLPPLMVGFPADPAYASVQIVGQGVDQAAPAAPDATGDDRPVVVLVPGQATPLTAAAHPMVTQQTMVSHGAFAFGLGARGGSQAAFRPCGADSTSLSLDSTVLGRSPFILFRPRRSPKRNEPLMRRMTRIKAGPAKSEGESISC